MIYDDANRLIKLENRTSAGSVIATYDFTNADGSNNPDGNGNILQSIQDEPLAPMVTSGTMDFTYNNEKNRLISAGSASFSFDAEGQLQDKNRVSYAFDFEHRLKSIGGPNPVQYFYDGKGNRIKADRNGVATQYIYGAGGNLLAEADGSGAITRYYIYGLGLMAMVAPGTPDQVYAYHFSYNSNTIAMTEVMRI